MTELLEQTFQKATRELNEIEQDLLAQFLLQHHLHHFLTEEMFLLSQYNVETQQAIRETAERKNSNYYRSIDEFFTKLTL